MKTIMKSSEQAKKERESNIEDRSCPECGEVCLFGSYTSKTSGIIKVKMQKMKFYSCSECGCKWNTGWREC